MGYSAYFVFNAYLVFYYAPKSDICSSSGSSPQHLSSFIRSMMVLDTLQRRLQVFLKEVNLFIFTNLPSFSNLFRFNFC